MKLTISAAEIERLMKGVFGRASTKKAVLKITAIDGKLILQSGNGGAATLAAVTSAGEVTLPAKSFSQVLDTYSPTDRLEIEGSAAGLRLNSLKMPISSWNASPTTPDGF